MIQVPHRDIAVPVGFGELLGCSFSAKVGEAATNRTVSGIILDACLHTPARDQIGSDNGFSHRPKWAQGMQVGVHVRNEVLHTVVLGALKYCVTIEYVPTKQLATILEGNPGESNRPEEIPMSSPSDLVDGRFRVAVAAARFFVANPHLGSQE